MLHGIAQRAVGGEIHRNPVRAARPAQCRASPGSPGSGSAESKSGSSRPASRMGESLNQPHRRIDVPASWADGHLGRRSRHCSVPSWGTPPAATHPARRTLPCQPRQVTPCCVAASAGQAPALPARGDRRRSRHTRVGASRGWGGHVGGVRLSKGSWCGGWGPRPVKGRGAGPPIRLGPTPPRRGPRGRHHPDQHPGTAQALDRPPAPRPAPTPQPNAQRQKRGRVTMTGKQNQFIHGFYRQHILAGVIIARAATRSGRHPRRRDRRRRQPPRRLRSAVDDHPVRHGRRDGLHPGLARRRRPVDL